MINISTVSDYNYLDKGLVLYDSLLMYNPNIKLHYLCLDGNSYDKVKKYESVNLVAYNVNDLLSSDPILAKLKENNYKYFCWSLASYFTNYLMNQNIGDITYIDSDIKFYDNINLILDAIGEKEIGIFRHRQFPLDKPRPEGFYNVGVVHFKNKEIGKYVLNWWSDAVLHQKYPHLNTCGDQKYLDEFPNLCPADFLFIDGDIGHGAPWQWHLFDFSDYDKDGSIIWEGKKQKLMFSHFSQFIMNENSYIPTTMHHQYMTVDRYDKIPNLKRIYDDYYNNLKNIKNKYD